MTEENKTGKKYKGIFVRDAYWVSAIIIAIIILMGSIISPFVWKAGIDIKTAYNMKEINMLRRDVDGLKGISIQVKDMNEKLNNIYNYLLKKKR